MYYLHLDDFAIVGSSPEILTRVDNDNVATIRPIAGTRSRGKILEEDINNEKDLIVATLSLSTLVRISGEEPTIAKSSR